MMSVRYSKILLVASIGLLATLTAFNNIFDYESNFLYVQHILSMDTTFPENHLQWRAIKSPIIHHASYVLIILVELLTGILCFLGTYRLFSVVKESSILFNKEKEIAMRGLTTGFLLWFVGFLVIGGEWFLMWQSEDWNVQQPAFRFIGCIGLVLLYLNAEDKDFG